MPDPGYGPNGERIPPSGLVSWEAVAPPEVIPIGDDVWFIQPLGMTFIPTIYQADDEAWSSIYLGGA